MKTSKTHQREARDQQLLLNLAHRVASRRKSLGFSLKRCSELSGFSSRYLMQLEAGEANVSLVKLAHLSNVLGVRLAELLSDGERGRIDGLLSSLSTDQLEEAFQILSARFLPRARTAIALLGIRGSGKSTLGRGLASALGCPFIELDEAIERESGLGLNELFSLYGEAYYARLEGEQLTQLSLNSTPVVIATGGSIVARRTHFDQLKTFAFTVYLKASAEELMRRVIAQGDHRPMQGHPHAMQALHALINTRDPSYLEADHVIETERSSILEMVDQLYTWSASVIDLYGQG